MSPHKLITAQTRKTRLVLTSDTHNHTPNLPAGDVLLHAGDLTRQGSRGELERVVEWLEGLDFEAKIVVAGNHDLTLDNPWYTTHHTTRKWPTPQDPTFNRALLTASKSLTYLENSATIIYLSSPTGPHTAFKVYGSPRSPDSGGNWAFGYTPGSVGQWDDVPHDADIVVTHTPPRGHCDGAVHSGRTGCEVLLQALHRVRPMVSVFGHIHEGRGVERVRWGTGAEGMTTVEKWTDTGTGKKISRVDLTRRGGRPLDNCSGLTRQTGKNEAGGQGGAGGWSGDRQRSDIAMDEEGAVGEVESRAGGVVGLGDATATGEHGHGQGVCPSEIGHGRCQPDVEAGGRGRRETVMVNAAFLGPHHLKTTFNKPIVVDVDLPVWREVGDAE